MQNRHHISFFVKNMHAKWIPMIKLREIIFKIGNINIYYFITIYTQYEENLILRSIIMLPLTLKGSKLI